MTQNQAIRSSWRLLPLPTCCRLVLLFSLLAAPACLPAQAPLSSRPSADVAVTFIAERSLKAATSQNFWMQGGSAEAGATLAHGVGLALRYTGTHTSSIGTTGVPLTLSVIAAGPRYRWHPQHRLVPYGETLFGVALGSDSLFPQAGGATTTAHSFALDLNAGLDYKLSPRIALRPLNVGYLRTTLPNATNNLQNTLQLSAGLVLRFGH